MASGKLLPLPDRALPRPARENRCHRCGMRLASWSGESQAKTHNTMRARTSPQAAAV